MRIAQVVAYSEPVPPQSKNGLEFMASWLTEELVARGHDVTLFAPEGSKTSAKLISLIPSALTQDSGASWQPPAFSMWNATHAASLASEFDIIHCHTRDIAYSLAFIKTPVIFTLHHRFEDDIWRPYFNDPKIQQQMRFILDQQAKIFYVPVSKKQEQDFALAKDSYFKKYRRIPHGIPVEHFEFNDTPQDYFLYLGYINKNKGADVAVQIARELDLKLILAGDNIGQETFFKEHIQPYLSDKIRYLGPVGFKEKNELYKHALATLAPLDWDEPFGLTLLESQACGTPVIAFNKGAAAELINHGKTGFVVENKSGMIETIKKIKTLDRKAARKWVQKHFSIKNMVDAYETLYKEII